MKSKINNKKNTGLVSMNLILWIYTKKDKIIKQEDGKALF